MSFSICGDKWENKVGITLFSIHFPIRMQSGVTNICQDRRMGMTGQLSRPVVGVMFQCGALLTNYPDPDPELKHD